MSREARIGSLSPGKATRRVSSSFELSKTISHGYVSPYIFNYTQIMKNYHRKKKHTANICSHSKLLLLEITSAVNIFIDTS